MKNREKTAKAREKHPKAREKRVKNVKTMFCTIMCFLCDFVLETVVPFCSFHLCLCLIPCHVTSDLSQHTLFVTAIMLFVIFSVADHTSGGVNTNAAQRLSYN